MMSRLSMAHSARSASSMIKSGAPGIFVSLNVNDDPKKASIKVTGSQLRVITTEQRKDFDMDDSQLKQKVNEYFGKTPNSVYTNDPTPWNNLYETYGWKPVEVHLKPVSAVITGVTSNPVILASKTFSNNSNVTGIFNTDISDEVTNTFESTYSNSFATTMGQEISYGVEGIAGGTTSFEFTAESGESYSTTYSSTVGASSGVTVTLAPNQSVIAELSSFRGTLNARVTYEASLTGQVACNYNPTFQGHHFWGLAVGRVMGSPKQTIVEDMEISYYSTGSVNLVDVETVKFMSAAGKMGTVGEMGTARKFAKHFVATAGTK